MHSYPSQLETWVTAANGGQFFVRPIRADDVELLRQEVDAADPETLYQRFFTPNPKFSKDTLAYLTSVDYVRRMALIAFTAEGEAVGIARYEALSDNSAEIAVAVKSEMRRQGIARLLLEMVIELAATNGFDRLEAICLADNEAVIGLVEAIGFALNEPDKGLVMASLDVSRRSSAISASS